MPFTHRTVIALLIGLSTLLGVGSWSYRNAEREQEDRRWVAHTYQVLAALATLETDIAKMQRERNAPNNLSSDISELLQLTADNTSQQGRLEALAAAIAISTEASGTVLNEMRAEEERLLRDRRMKAESASRSTKLAILFGTVLAVSFLLASGIAVKRELKERQSAEQALHESEERFRLAVEDVTGYAIITLDTDGNIATWNAGAEGIKGYRAEEIIGKHFSCFYLPEDVAADKPRMKLSIAARDGRIEDEGWRVRKDQSRFWGNVVITAMRSADGKLIGFSKVTRDLTDRKRAEEEVKLLNQRLEQRVAELTAANRELDAFTYSLAHDLRAPLRHIHGFANILSQDWQAEMDGDGQRLLGKVVKSSKEMGLLVDDLLNFARLGRVELQRAPVDLSQVVEEVRQQLEPETQGRSIMWEVDDLPVVAGDAALLRQVFVNLLSNAVKYTSKEDTAKIEVGSRNGENKTMVFVRDNGSGFEMKYADKLFRVFQRLHRAEEFEGTGIGLANVRRIIERHGGHVWAEGEPGVGATFYLHLPAKGIS